MQIKDLETSHEMARDELSAVRGGFNVGSVGGQQANQTVFGSGGIFSPVTAVNAPVNAPVLTQLDVHPTTIVDLDTNNVLASQNTLIGGFGGLKQA
jgi:hypothetical protein